jgi:hypothetical protein
LASLDRLELANRRFAFDNHRRAETSADTNECCAKKVGKVPMPSPVETAAIAIVERLVTLAAQDSEIRSHLRILAKAFLESTSELPTVPEVAPESPAASDPLPEQVESVFQAVEAAISVVDVPAAVESLPLPELTLGRSPPTEDVGPAYPVQRASKADLATIEVRCRLKAEGTRWVLKSRVCYAGSHLCSLAVTSDPQHTMRSKKPSASAT